VTRAVSEAAENGIADFIYEEIFLHYGALQEIFSDSGKNLWGGPEVPKKD
jgi:hypothetical protein